MTDPDVPRPGGGAGPAGPAGAVTVAPAGRAGAVTVAPAGRAGAVPVAPTGEPTVDAALERLEALRTAPLAETPAGFDEVHQLLHMTLVDDGR